MIRRIINRIIFQINNLSCKIESGVTVSRKTKVGKNCHLARNCIVSANVILGNNVMVGEGSRLRNISIDDNSQIESGVRVTGTGKGYVSIGKECYIGVNNILDTSDSIKIGDFVHIAGPSTALWCHSSVQMSMNSIPLNDENRERYRSTSPIRIKNNVYIGGNCTIYPGVIINHNCIVAPNSAVSKDVETNTLIGGVPAKVIKKIS